MNAATAEDAIMSTTGSILQSQSQAGATLQKPGSACCGGPAPEGVTACCARDGEAKSAGGAGCGCNPAPAQAPEPPRSLSGCCGW